MKIAIVGSREFKNKDFVQNIVSNQLTNGDYFISGGARGVDTWAEETIPILETGLANFKINKKIFKPDWNKYGKRAGFLRNQLIIDEADKVIAFWDGKSKGTKHSIDLAIKANKPIDIYIRN
jgi:uncharacterized phage-like protein YoqJ